MSADLQLLRRLMQGPVSGDALAGDAGLTRAAVWKRVEALRAQGVAIVARPGQGYALAAPLDLLDADAIRVALPAALRDVVALEVAWSIDSTSAGLLRRAPPPHGVEVLLAEYQTAGRGRRGRHWVSPLAANLTLSLSRLFDGGLARLGGLSLVAGVAVAEALQGLGVEGVLLKWPNDLVVVDAAGTVPVLRKLGGLLVEGGGENAGPVRAVLGLGLNVRMPARAAADVDQPWTDLSRLLDVVPARSALAAALLARLLPALAQFDRDGLAPFLPRYAACDALAGRAVDVHLGDTVHRGQALGLANDGALRVALAGGERRFHSGEVSVRAAGGKAP